MVAFSRSFGSAVLFAAGAQGARISRKRATEAGPTTKFIAGVPLLNYQTAFEGEPILAEGEREGEWVVMLKAGASDTQIQKLCKAAPNGCKLAGHSTGVPFLEFRGTEKDLEAVISLAEGAVRYVEPDQTVHMIPEIESDTVEAATWGLNRIGADARPSQGGSATVFVLDTGVRHTHNDFTGRASPALDMTTGSPVVCDPTDFGCADDKQGHGTHCAGTAAGDQWGVAPAAAVKSVKVLSDQGSGSWSWSYYALDWLASNPTRPAISSMSLGGSGTQQAMADAVNGAVNAGVVVVVAGGNSNSDACRFSPAFVPSAITVGSTTSTDTRSSFSNYGTCTNIWAPGSAVVSASHTSDTGSRSLSGTSMACPHVSGAAAILFDTDPSKSASAILSEMLDNAVLNGLTGLRNGDTNALLYVGAGGPPPTPEPVPTPAPPPSACNPAYSTGPDGDGDCICNSGLTCFESGSRGCTYSYTARYGWTSTRYFLETCSACVCQ